ncbi:MULTISPECIES: heme exporter protein CcmB [Olivibacter]|jgi:heme exporter protein B|uniref:Cytochrome c-type biogenesis protein CcmB n=3 Tax=Sphingobacteriaceae TaxID=84566 RepID=F4C3R6_SPHS2|nr:MULTISPECIES: heme exporter protein CcmB [Olivibacter]MCL4637733.1 heme exporter protein CcmB [Olivibacter sp. UJ_SKK_5.1]MDX3913476.1 heme exporter protein CcmB [Pseudosphingobacterium sp.]QEL01633.1 ABC transporter permease [Olivibacter sp. LS-1]
MNLFRQVNVLLQKEIRLEWRSKYALNGILLYVVSTVFVCYQAFKSVHPVIWNALFWIILLFTAINAIAKSFTQESKGRHLYYYTLVSAQAVILSKIIYNMLLMLLLAAVAFFSYSTIFKNEIGDPTLYFITILIGSISFGTTLTMVSGISAKAGSNGTLMAILSFPVLIPVIIVLIKLSKNAMDGLERSVSYDEIGVLLAINLIVITVSLLLFPYIWKD